MVTNVYRGPNLHGINIAGKWSLLGILDAVPDEGAKNSFPTNDMTPAFVERGLIPIVESLAPVTRFLLGRPNNYFGVTPMLIFREVGHIGKVSRHSDH